MAYDPGPEGWRDECDRLVPLAPRIPGQRWRSVLADHRSYRYPEPFTGGPGQCPGGAQPPARVTAAVRIDGSVPLP